MVPGAGGPMRPDPRDRRVRTAPATPTVRQGARPTPATWALLNRVDDRDPLTLSLPPLVTAAPSPASHRRRARAQGARAGRTGRRRLAQRRDMAGARHGPDPEAVITAGRHPSLRRIERVKRDLRRVRGGIVHGCAIHDRERDAHEPRGDAQEGEGDEPQEVRGVLPTVPTHRSHGHRGG